MKTSPQELKSRVAAEAATLLYYGAEKEYKQAKLKAAQTFGTHFLPSNHDVALELDRIVEEHEGATRKEHLVQMRRDALNIMTALKAYCPRLIGSVWRGTARKTSDIDIAVYHDAPEELPNILESYGFRVSTTEWVTVTKQGKTETSFHINVTLGNHTAEVVVRNLEEANRKRTCEVFGDTITGLTFQELAKVLDEDPTRKFLPT